MAGKKVVTEVENLITPLLKEAGYEVVEIVYQKQITGMNLTIVIDKEGGISINDCEFVSKLIDKPLDDLDPTDGVAYNLNVSSPGLDRPIKNELDFKRNKNCEIEIKFYEPYKTLNVKKVIGQLLDWNKETVTVLINNEKLIIEKQKIAQMVPVIKF